MTAINLADAASRTLNSKPRLFDERFSLYRSVSRSSPSSFLFLAVDGFDVCIAAIDHLGGHWVVTTLGASETGRSEVVHPTPYATRSLAESAAWDMRDEVAKQL
jgi:hypothetical protein